MKNFTDKKNKRKAISLSIAAILIFTTIVASANTIENKNGTQNREGYTVEIQDTTAEPGTTGHLIGITGSWEEEIFALFIRINYGPTLGIGDINITNISFEGCIQEPINSATNINNGDTTGSILAYVLFGGPPYTEGNGIPAGSGKLFNIVVDIAETAEAQEIDFVLSDSLSPWYAILQGAHAEPTVTPGVLAIMLPDTTPPSTTIELDGEMQGEDYASDVTVTLSATDDSSGVDFTMIKVDDESYEEYNEPAVVSGLGSHTVYYYSVDNAGNEEDEKSETFEIVDAQPNLKIKSIEGGTGITAVIENEGEGDATDLEWAITIEGGFFILTKEVTGTEDVIEAGDEAEITMSVFGIGLGIITDMPVITVSAECAEGSSDSDSAEAKIILSKVTIQ